MQLYIIAPEKKSPLRAGWDEMKLEVMVHVLLLKTFRHRPV
jgi:hypothetical protein